MDKIFESKPMKALQHLGDVIGQNKAVSAIQAAMMSLMGVIMAGSIFSIIAQVPVAFNLWTAESQIYTALYGVYNLTFNLLSLWFVLLLGYNYSKMLGLKPLPGAIQAAISFLLVASNGWMTGSMEALTTQYLGGMGLFVAILVGLISTWIYNLCVKKNIVIKMPDQVPPFLAEGFSSIIPLALSVLLQLVINVLIFNFTGVGLSEILIGLFSALMGFGTSFPAMLIIGLICGLFWIFGIHGTMMAYVAVMAPMMAVMTENATVWATTGDITQIVYNPVMLFGFMACAGGTGNTLSLAIMGLRAKSEQLRAVSKAGLIPGVCNINEPVTFGFPIMYNPLMAIPYLLSIVVAMVLGHIFYSVGILYPSVVPVAGLLPIGVNELIGILPCINIAWFNVLFPIIVVAVTYVIYLPFFKAYDKQLYAKEQAEKEAA